MVAARAERVAAGFVGWAWASLASPTYRAEAKLLVGPVNTDFRPRCRPPGSWRTYSDLATSRPVLAAAIRSTEGADDRPRPRGARHRDGERADRLVTISVEDSDEHTRRRRSPTRLRPRPPLSRRSPAADTTAVEALMRDSDIAALERAERARVQAAARRVLGNLAGGRRDRRRPGDAARGPVAPKVPLITLLCGDGGPAVGAVFVFLKDAGSQG